MSRSVVALRGLSKRYGRVLALSDVTLEVPPGPVGLLGPNGAGKSTLIRLLLGLLRPDGGEARIAGFDPARPSERLEIRRAVGYMPEGDCLIAGMNAVDLVQTLGRLTGLSRRDAMTRSHEVLDYVGLEEARYRRLDEYSTGMKQRLKLAQALVHDPDILLLDEPTNGLDPKGRRHMLELVYDLGHHQGKHLLFCSHLLPDVERTCREVVVIDRGRVLQTGSIEEMTESDGLWVQVDVVEGGERFAAGLEERGHEFERRSEFAFRVRVESGAGEPGEGAANQAAGDGLFALARDAQVVVASLAPERSSLEEVFLQALDGAEESR